MAARRALAGPSSRRSSSSSSTAAIRSRSAGGSNIVFFLFAALLVPMAIPKVPFKRENALLLLVVFPVVALVLLTGGNFDFGASTTHDPDRRARRGGRLLAADERHSGDRQPAVPSRRHRARGRRGARDHRDAALACCRSHRRHRSRCTTSEAWSRAWVSAIRRCRSGPLALGVAGRSGRHSVAGRAHRQPHGSGSAAASADGGRSGRPSASSSSTLRSNFDFGLRAGRDVAAGAGCS